MNLCTHCFYAFNFIYDVDVDMKMEIEIEIDQDRDSDILAPRPTSHFMGNPKGSLTKVRFKTRVTIVTILIT